MPNGDLSSPSVAGGLRCPSEHLALKWADVDWQRKRIRISSPKTEHHEGGECRYIPMFPELVQPLNEVWDQATEGIEYVITQYRATNQNLRTQLIKIIKRAGLKPLLKLFQNLRSCRQTELAEEFPLHVVCEWIGNTRAVAGKHYLQTTDEHFNVRAAALQNAVQSVHAKTRNESHEKVPSVKNLGKFNTLRVGAEGGDGPKSRDMGGIGLEPTTSTMSTYLLIA